jgi:hypothetical protein
MAAHEGGLGFVIVIAALLLAQTGDKLEADFSYLGTELFDLFASQVENLL